MMAGSGPEAAVGNVEAGIRRGHGKIISVMLKSQNMVQVMGQQQVVMSARMTRPTRPVGTICPYPADVSDTCLSS
jgi:hypothetical protein